MSGDQQRAEPGRAGLEALLDVLRRRNPGYDFRAIPAAGEPLPLPGDDDTPFGVLVDRYAESHGVSRAETFRRIAEVTGNSPGTLSIRYRERGDRPWRFSHPDWRAILLGEAPRSWT